MLAAAPGVVLLDLDGTLTDSAPGIVNCLRYALDSMGVPHPDDDAMRAFLGPPLATSFREQLGMSDAEVARAIAAYRERYRDVGLFENDVYDGIPGLLEALRSAGHCLAVATSKPTAYATTILEHFDLARQFAVIGGADFEGTRHDKAAVIAHTLAELSGQGTHVADATVVMVGDRAQDVRGAREHGIDTVGVLWGYGSADELIGAGAVWVVATPADLATALIG